MKLKVFAVRYKEPIERFIESYFSDPSIDANNTFLTIINNYGELKNDDTRFTIINNTLRPDFSTGHLSRNWNQAIINGFKDLNNPDCDIVVCLQIDAILSSSWYTDIKFLFETQPHLHYVTLGRGDEFQYFKPDIVKKIGLFDERFCNIGYQEADYFLRARIKGQENVMIGDIWHRRVFNYIHFKDNFIINNQNIPFEIGLNEHHKSTQFHSVSKSIFHYKWGNVLDPEQWNLQMCFPLNFTDNKEFKYYPYFEKNINPDIYVCG